MSEMRKHILPPSLSIFFNDIKLAHSIFALPFVLSSLVFLKFHWNLRTFSLIIACMVCARSFAMGMNRFLDRKWDALNPRTRVRMIPSGQLEPSKSLLWSLAFGAGFIFFALKLSPTAAICSPFVLLILGLYPLMKNISWLTHWYLGMCLGLSPIAAGVALNGSVSPELILLGLAITMWTAGFDILYSLQDYSFDKDFSLKSAPTRFGVRKSLNLSRICFVFMVLLLVGIGVLRESGILYYLGIFLIGSILIWEHWIVRDSNEELSSPNINIAFFNANACVGVIFFFFTLLDTYLKQ